MASKRSFLETIDDELHCSICMDLPTDPQALRCLHTFCKQCIEQVINNEQIVCPTCRSITNDDELVNNFQVKSLVEAYKKQRTAECANQPGGKPARPCDLCKQHSIEVYCKECSHYMCTSCFNVHILPCQCQAHHAVGLDQRLHQLKEMLGERLGELKSETFMNSTIKATVIEQTDSSYNECLKSLNDSENRDMQQVLQLYKEEKDKALSWRNARVDLVNHDYQDMDDVTNDMDQEVNDLNNASSTSVESIDAHVHLLQRMDGELTKQKTFHWKSVKFEVKNKDMEVVRSQGPKVEKSDKHFLSGVDLEKSFSGITIHGIANVQGLTVANNAIVALLSGTPSSRLVQLTDSGKKRRIICDSELGQAFGITSSRNEIIVASNVGLLAVSFDGQIIEIISEESYQHCCTSTSGLVYAIWSNKPNGCMYVDVVNNGNILQTIKTNVKRNGNMTCMAGPDSNTIFICCELQPCIYEIGLPSGHLIEVFGYNGNGNTELGNFKRPFLGLCAFSDLVIADSLNNQLQSFNLKKKTWRMIRLPVLLAPKCLIIKDTCLYVGGKHLFIYR